MSCSMLKNHKMKEEIGILLDFTKSDYKPAVEAFNEGLQNLLKSAELERRNCLIAKTTGTVTSIVATGLTVAGLLLAPATAGISALAVTGIGMGIAGGSVTTGTMITDRLYIRKQHQDEIKRLYQVYQETWKTWFSMLDAISSKYFSGELIKKMKINEQERNNAVKLQIMKGEFDERVEISDLELGDHIYRYKYRSWTTYHHAIYLGKMDGIDTVIDFDSSSVPVIKPIDQFFYTRKTLFRRNYLGTEIPILETIDLAKKSIREFRKYDVLQYNCEHFATELKIKMPSSSQIANIAKGTVVALKDLRRSPRHVQVGLETAVTIKNTMANLPLGAAMTKFAKFTLVLAPIVTAVELGMLVHDFNIKQSNFQNIEKAIKHGEGELLFCTEFIEFFTKILTREVFRGVMRELLETFTMKSTSLMDN